MPKRGPTLKLALKAIRKDRRVTASLIRVKPPFVVRIGFAHAPQFMDQGMNFRIEIIAHQ
jgi:hypothetical protein